MRIGLMLPMSDESQPGNPRPYTEIRDTALHAESTGFDTLWVYDHLYGDNDENTEGLPREAWTTLTALAEATSRVRLGALVFCTAFRSPGVIAQMADGIQEISDGRLILGLGAGWHKPEFDAFGFPFDHLASRFAEAIEIITSMLRDGRATFDGEYYQAKGAPIIDRPGRTTPPILVASTKPRMLELTARYADSWNHAWYGVPDDAFREVNDKLSGACKAIGRDPAEVERTVGVVIGEPGVLGKRTVPLDKSAIADAVAAWKAEGVAEVIFAMFPNNRANLELLADAAINA